MSNEISSNWRDKTADEEDKRIFYDVDADDSLVRIVAIGYKEKNRLLFRGQEYQP